VSDLRSFRGAEFVENRYIFVYVYKQLSADYANKANGYVQPKLQAKFITNWKNIAQKHMKPVQSRSNQLRQRKITNKYYV